jgi:hypothetical protein
MIAYLSFFGPMMSYLIIYKKITKLNEVQEKAQRIWAGLCTEWKLHSNWCSSTDTVSLLPACVFITQDTVRHLRRFLFRKFVREPICLWWKAFMNQRSTVFVNKIFSHFICNMWYQIYYQNLLESWFALTWLDSVNGYVPPVILIHRIRFV